MNAHVLGRNLLGANSAPCRLTHPEGQKGGLLGNRSLQVSLVGGVTLMLGGPNTRQSR